jgi:uncharacterized protein (UPF0548 family)
VKVFFAARVLQTFDELRDGLWRAGFTYRTLPGHPEIGQETFAVEKVPASGQVTASLRSWSRPGLWVTRLGYPLARLSQRIANRAALRQLQRMATG